MKILLINKFHYLKGGSETYYFTLAEALKAKGHEVIFFAMQDEKNIESKQNKYFVSNVGVSGGVKGKIKMILNIAYSKEAYRNLEKLIIDEKPDLAILNLVHKQLTCSVIDVLKKYQVKIFWTMHDLITVCPAYTMLDGNGNICEKCLGGKFNNCLKNKCAHGSTLMSLLSTYEAKYIKKHKFYDDVDLYICPSNFYKKKLEEGKFTTSKIVYMRNPLALDTKYELSSNVKDYILYFGRLTKEKGVKTLISSMKNIDYKLIILGTGPIEEELKTYVKDNNLESKVSLLGFKSGEELKTYVREAKVVVLPSEWYENGPYSAMEAMASGKPLIVSNNGGLPELVEDGVNGYIFNNKEELSIKLNKIISLDDEKYLKMCESSLNKAKEWFNPLNYVDELLKKVK